MSEIKTSEVLEVLDKIQFFSGQRAGRELWADKPTEVQDKDLEDYNRDIEKVRKYIESKSNAMERIVEILEEEMPISWEHDYIGGMKDAFMEAIEIVKEEGGIND